MLDFNLRFTMLQATLHLVKHKMLPSVLLKQLTDRIISVPQLDVHLIGARHLPSSFGLKTVEGYVVKVVRSKSSMQSRGKYFLISSRLSFSPDQQSSTRRSKRLHGQSLMKHFDFQWHHCTSNTVIGFQPRQVHLILSNTGCNFISDRH